MAKYPTGLLEFDKLPEGLRQIVNDPERRKKLVVYINPQYAEHSNRKVIVGTGDNRTNVAKLSKVHAEFLPHVGPAVRELYVQFFLRIYRDIPDAILGSFSTLKFVCSQNCKAFRLYWRASFRRGFICPADTFDNVNGEFPIAFTVWRLCCEEEIKSVSLHVMERDTRYVGEKSFYACESKRMISDWLRTKYDSASNPIGYLALPGVSMQQRASMFLTSKPTESDVRQHKVANVTSLNIIPCCVYLAVRHCIAPEWTNNKDEFRFPVEDWEGNAEFKGDCLVWALFDNTIKSEHGVNHWIPFTEEEVGAQDCFASHFMSDFLKGKKNGDAESFPRQMELATPTRSGKDSGRASPIAGAIAPFSFTISTEAKAVLDAGRELWRYYHRQPKANPNASYYDIRRHFQGMKVTAKGKEQMKSTSDDERYNELHAALKQAMKRLAAKIQPKVYEYGFLKK